MLDTVAGLPMRAHYGLKVVTSAMQDLDTVSNKLCYCRTIMLECPGRL